jgi:hypothetical protein
MKTSIFLAILAILIFAWYLSFLATRLDRLHHRVETSWANLDALLQIRQIRDEAKQRISEILVTVGK